MVFPQVSGVRKHSALGSGDGLSGDGGWPNEEVQEMLTCLLDVGVEEGKVGWRGGWKERTDGERERGRERNREKI